jgi:hypothetical protein
VVWIGATNLPLEATGSLLSATSLLGDNWHTGSPFVITATATNWPVPVVSSNAFYRLQPE